MADDIRVVLHDIGEDLARRGASAAIGAFAETRVGESTIGRAGLDIVRNLLDEYGDDAVEAIARMIHARQKRRIDRMVDEAKAENDADLETTLARIKREMGE